MHRNTKVTRNPHKNHEKKPAVFSLSLFHLSKCILIVADCLNFWWSLRRDIRGFFHWALLLNIFSEPKNFYFCCRNWMLSPKIMLFPNKINFKIKLINWTRTGMYIKDKSNMKMIKCKDLGQLTISTYAHITETIFFTDSWKNWSSLTSNLKSVRIVCLQSRKKIRLSQKTRQSIKKLHKYDKYLCPIVT